ncbi:MAG: hypothetical protein R2708_13860 [Vicinamibacterales bacterium]
MRELQNCLERAAILADGPVIRARHLRLVEPSAAPSAPASPAAAPDLDLRGTLAEVTARARDAAERRKLEAVLAETASDMHQAATALDVPFRELIARMRLHGLGTD